MVKKTNESETNHMNAMLIIENDSLKKRLKMVEQENKKLKKIISTEENKDGKDKN